MRVHPEKRKRLFDHPKYRDQNRMTLHYDINDNFAYKDDEPDRKRLKLNHDWKGMTVFYTDRPKPTEPIDVRYIDTPEGLIKVNLNYEELQNINAIFCTWNAMPNGLGDYEECGGMHKEIYALVNKKSAKELDERYFNPRERKAFNEADLEEWRQWIRKEAIETVPLSWEEASKIPKDQIISAPMRHVRTNKGMDDYDLIAKSRMIVPGHLDPQIGLHRTDAPTTTCLAVFIISILAVSFGWWGEIFDVNGAFLSGKPMERECYVRAPKDGLPAVDGHARIKPYSLLRRLKAAYGLQEAPRLW